MMNLSYWDILRMFMDKGSHQRIPSVKHGLCWRFLIDSDDQRMIRCPVPGQPSAGSSPAPNQKSFNGTSHPHLYPGSLEMIHKCWYYGLIVGTMDWWGLIVDSQLFGTIHINYQFPSIPHSHIGSQNYEIEHIPAGCWLVLLVWQKQWIGLRGKITGKPHI